MFFFALVVLTLLCLYRAHSNVRYDRDFFKYRRLHAHRDVYLTLALIYSRLKRDREEDDEWDALWHFGEERDLTRFSKDVNPTFAFFDKVTLNLTSCTSDVTVVWTILWVISRRG